MSNHIYKKTSDKLSRFKKMNLENMKLENILIKTELFCIANI